MSNIILRKDSCNVNSQWPSRIKIGFYFFKDICVIIRCAGTCKLLFLTLSYGSLLRQVQYKIIYHALNRNKYCALVQSFSFICIFCVLRPQKWRKTQKVMRLNGNRIAFERKDLPLMVTFCVETKNIGLNAKLLLHLNTLYLGNQRNVHIIFNLMK